MSLTVFLGFCILGCDCLLYILFQWIYGEKHRNRPRRSATRRSSLAVRLKFFLFKLLRTLLRLFAPHQKLNSFVFERFHTLCTKHPGEGG